MRIDLELTGVTDSGCKVVMRTSVYARSQEQLQAEVEKAAAAGPWHDDVGCDVHPDEDRETITIENVRAIPRRGEG